MRPQTKQAATAVGAAVAGATVGYLAGVLTAPASGAETRRKIARKVEEDADAITRRAERTMKNAKERIVHAMHA